MNISVIIPTKDRSKSLLKCIKSIAKQSHVPDEIVIVDASEKQKGDLKKKLQKESSKIPIIYLKTKPGLNFQRNIGADKSSGDILIFFDDDVVLEINYINSIYEIFKSDSSVSCVTGKIINSTDNNLLGPNSIVRKILWPFKYGSGTFTSYGYVRYLCDTNKICNVEFMSGGNMAVKKNVWEDILFDENLKGYSLCDDEDFSYRASRKYKIVFTPHAKLNHFKEPTARLNEKELNKMLVLNRYYLFKKNFNKTLSAKIGFIGLLLFLFIHRLFNRRWKALHGFTEAFWDIITNENFSNKVIK